jgi:tetratricopeptide (TPR) repeat protein
MTCTTCPAPHLPVSAQGPAAFDAACQSCHARGDCVRPEGMAVEEAAGTPARTPDGCVDCHVRRSQPYDLQHVRTADHLVRRRIEPPQELPPRLQHDPAAGLAVFDDGRLAAALATPEGRRWSDGLRALGLWKLGRPAEAAALLAPLPPPGSPKARVATAPPGLQPLETSANFHHLRGLILEAVGRPAEARAAYDDALALDEAHPEARVNRASLRLAAGDLDGALQDAALLLQLYPRAEKGWNLRALAAAQAGDLPAACDALRRSLALWPGDAATWQLLGRLLLRQGAANEAQRALGAAAALDASLPGLREDLAAAGAR